MGRSYFITSTDTGVGKTFISAGILALAERTGFSVGYLKPITSGGVEDAKFVKKKADLADPIELISPICFKQPLAPFASGKTEKTKVDMSLIKKTFRSIEKFREFTVVEGIGGVAVPLAKGLYVADMIKALNIPTIIVARAGLGTINHTLLSIGFLASKGINIKGIILNGFTGKELSERSNAQIIEELSEIPVIARISANLTFDGLVKQLKHQKVLEQLI